MSSKIIISSANYHDGEKLINKFVDTNNFEKIGNIMIEVCDDYHCQEYNSGTLFKCNVNNIITDVIVKDIDVNDGIIEMLDNKFIEFKIENNDIHHIDNKKIE